MTNISKYLFPIIFLLIIQQLSAQKLSLIDLHAIASHKSWETSNKLLIAKGWDYYDSSKSDGEGYNKIWWAHGRTEYDNARAKAWVYIYNYEGLPNKIMYRFRQKEFYTTISKQITANAYKLTGEEILDNRVVALYENKSFYLEIAYTREEDEKDDNYYENSNKKTYTVYEATIYKKGGIYDPNNGVKKEYDENDNLISTYNLKDGKLDGLYTTYDSIGRINKTFHLKMGSKEGIYTEKLVLDSSGDYYLLEGSYLNNEKEGRWTGKIVTPTEKYTVQDFFFIKGKKEGVQKEAKQNQILFRNYKNDNLEGISYDYTDFTKELSGGYSTLDTLKIKVFKSSELTYSSNKLNGSAKYFDISGSLIAEGVYQDSLKTGSWKYYYENIKDEHDVAVSYSKKLFKESTFLNDKLNGIQISYSFLNKVEKPCEGSDTNTNDCYEMVYVSINEIANYKDDELDGNYELKGPNDNLWRKGTYTNGKESGKWVDYNNSKFSQWLNKKTYETGMYVNGVKEGKWERFENEGMLLESYAYSGDLINGDHITYAFDKPTEKKHFAKGKLLKIEEFDASGNIKKSYLFKNDTATKFDCVVEETLPTGVFSSTFSFIKTLNFEISPLTFQFDFLSADPSVKKLNGLYEHKTLDNKTLEIGNYTTGVQTGNWDEYFYDQNIRTSIDYNGYGQVVNEFYYTITPKIMFTGEFVYKNKDGLLEERKIKDGVRNGATRYKDANDKTIKKEYYKQGVLEE